MSALTNFPFSARSSEIHQPGGGIRRHGILVKIADADGKIRRV